MLFALATKDGRLLAFGSAEEAVSHCPGNDVRLAKWRFYADDGSPLEARFVPAMLPGGADAGSGAYALQRAMSGLWLQERLDQVESVQGCGLATVAQLEEALRINRSKRIAPGFRGARQEPDP